MKYNQNKKIALNKSNGLGLRYTSLLRCISHVCKLNDGVVFWKVLFFLDTGLITEKDKEKASNKIIETISALDERLSGSPFKFENGNSSAEYDSTKRVVYSDSSAVDSLWERAKNLFSREKLALGLTKKEVSRIYRKDYQRLYPSIESHSTSLCALLKNKLNHLGDSIAFPPQHRAKELNSVIAKIFRDTKKYLKFEGAIENLSSIQDIIGLRVVTVFEKDIDAVENIIRKNFKIKRVYTPNYLDSGAAAEYPAKHIVINTLVPVEDEEKKLNFLCEIQVMTLAQYTFTKASHSLFYKNSLSRKQKRSTIRSLKRASAMLESVDLELNRNVPKKD